MTYLAAREAVIRETHAVFRFDAKLEDGHGLVFRVVRLWSDGSERMEMRHPSAILDGGGKATVPLVDDSTPQDSFVREVWPLIETTGGLLPVEVPSSYELGLLLPANDPDVTRLVFHKSSRYRDVGTLSFVMDQLIRYPGSKPLWVIEAAKILSYRAMESGSVVRARECLLLIDRALDQAKRLLNKHGLGKDSRYHAVTSLWGLRACLNISEGNIRSAIRDFQSIQRQIKSLEHSPMAANNIALAMCTLGYLFFCQKKYEDAISAWESTVIVFRVAAAHYPAKSPRIFAELNIAFDAAKFSTEAISSVRKSVKTEEAILSPAHIAREFFRVKGTRGAAHIEEVLKRFISAGAAKLTPSPKLASEDLQGDIRGRAVDPDRAL